tara:strand:+ start:615 stop:1778 length:1164 start_codon:yes stop_codon:yes gene_type:complete
MISYGKQSINQTDIDSLIRIFKGDWLTQGPTVKKFEADLKNYFGSDYACAVSNGTAALHLAGIALGWKKNDIVITSPLTFLSTVNSIVYSGATPEFVDIDFETYTLDPTKLEDKIKYYARSGKEVRAVIAVDFAGQPCDWKALNYLSQKYKFQLINDNCHSLGASYYGDKQYAVKYADAVIHSYHPVKHITTGEGGAVLTNNKELSDKVKKLRSHGMTKIEDELENNEGPWYYEMHELGYNYRITDFQCALGVSQLKRLDEFISKRQAIAQKYNNFFSDNDFVKVPKKYNDIDHAYHLYPLLINFKKIKLNKSDIFKIMLKEGVNLQVHYFPVHLQPYYKKKFGFKKGDYPLSEMFYENEISIPIYPDLKNNEQYKVMQLFKEIFND